MRNMDETAGLENQINSLLAEGRHHLAWAKIRDRLLEQPNRCLYSLAANFADEADTESAQLLPVRIAILGSFTLDPIVPILKAHALLSRVRAQIYVAQFNTWQQEVLTEHSGLRAFDPDVIFLAVRPEDLAPDLVYGFLGLNEIEIKAQVGQAIDALETFLVALRRWSKAKVVVHSLPAPAYPALGILDHELSTGQSAAFLELNKAWFHLAKRTPGVSVMDCDRLVREIGWNRWYDPRYWAVAKLPLTSAALERIAEEYAKYLKAFFGLARKVLVLDLDNTLWGGIVGEDGLHRLQLGSEYPGSAFLELQRVILSLHDRGVVLAINSKNNPDDAQEVIERHPAMILRPKHFAATRINWNDKAQNLQELAQELNLNLDSFVFVDDSAVECERIRQLLPQILTIHMAGEPALRPNRMRQLAGLFDTLEYSSEDRARNAMYRADGARKGLRSQTASLEDFYISLKMELIIERLSNLSLARAAQMTLRTNQFNLTTRRRSETELQMLLRSDENEVFTVRLRDRFGDEGIIALVITQADEGALLIDTFLMSCRVIGREVETALLTFVLKRAQALRCRQVIGEYRPTKKNGMVADFYARQGFVMFSCCEETTLWRLESPDFERNYPRWFRTDDNMEVAAYEYGRNRSSRDYDRRLVHQTRMHGGGLAADHRGMGLASAS
jgi:FkbH-like protein